VRRNRLLALAILAILSLAVLAPAGFANEGAAGRRAAKHAERDAKRQAAAQRQAERGAHRQQRGAERKAAAERGAERKAERKLLLGHKSDTNADVKIDCTSITIEYHDFNVVPGSPNFVWQGVHIKSPPPPLEPVNFPPKLFSFEGASATSVIPVAAPVGRSTVDIRSHWDTNGVKGGFDIHQTVTCPPHPALTIEKLQSLGGPFTTETLSGMVGQSIMYEMIVTNTGNTPLTFTGFSDALCDPGTISGEDTEPIEPLGTITIVCVHKITPADATAGKVLNVATITGTPEEGEGEPITERSNPVEVAPVTEEEHKKEPEPEDGNKEPPKPPPAKTTPNGGVAGISASSGASSTSTSKSGVLGFTSATIPSLRGPQGCVRSSFTASVKSANVASVSFYLDGHLLRRLSATAAHKGLLSIHINASKLKVGAHRIQARITMKAAKGAKPAKATRSMTVVRCHSAVIAPHFTG
jgi:uncharacterized repeat protein (TIGR01451 family)